MATTGLASPASCTHCGAFRGRHDTSCLTCRTPQLPAPRETTAGPGAASGGGALAPPRKDNSRPPPPRPDQGQVYAPPCFDGTWIAPETINLTVEVARYLTAAALGGILGNRADAASVRLAVTLFHAVRDRWQGRASTEGGDTGITEDEAVDLAKAAVRVHDLLPVSVTSAEHDTGGWVIVIATIGQRLRVRVPDGDPANATILIISDG